MAQFCSYWFQLTVITVRLARMNCSFRQTHDQIYGPLSGNTITGFRTFCRAIVKSGETIKKQSKQSKDSHIIRTILQ